MANRDGTGPQGQWPKTGSQKGNCEWAQFIAFWKGKGNKNCWKRKWEGNRRKALSTKKEE